MMRRRFLAALAHLAGLTAIFTPVRATRTRAPLLLQTSPIAGFQYHAGESVWTLLAPGAALALVRERANPHDENAVRVDWNGHKLGYVPRVQNHALAQLLDRGQALSARIEALQASRDPWQRVKFVVLLHV